MAKARLLQAVCTMAMLAAVPAFAQQTTGPGQGATGDSTATTPPGAPAANQSSTTDQGNGSMAPAPGGTHRATMSHSRRAMRSGTTDSQNAAVDQLNDQSLRAAQQGRTYSAAGDTGTMAPPAASSGTMSDTPGGATSGAGGTGGSMSGGTGGGATSR